MNNISHKKKCYPITENVNRYLMKYGRVEKLPLSYDSLLQYTDSFPLGNTLWISVMYPQDEFQQINKDLCYVYSLLKTEGDVSVIEHLRVDRIDFCLFGNSNPFRIKIINNFNDNYDYFYVKRTDVSRIFGLEMEDILSPNRITYFVDENTLIEEHISGIPGDDFIKTELSHPKTNKTRLAKEFIKFNERCFYTLLGDMRSYNYVVEITHDFDDVQYRIRAIDFDQQCYEGRRKIYLPQFYKENIALVKLVTDLLNPQTINQYQIEERSRIARRIKHSRYVLKDLFDTMIHEELSTKKKINQLKKELAEFHGDNRFLKYENMAKILKLHLVSLRKHLK
ncbi:MAG: hypothetical protein HYR91_07520 [Flavobacteriia bacterium]|nr:hypothetical protein [Flavobacteriia bacterium]